MDVIRAAVAANLWNSRQPRVGDKEEGKSAYFKEVPPKHQNQVKRKNPEPAEEKQSKKIKRTPTNGGDQAGGWASTDLKDSLKAIKEREDEMRRQETAAQQQMDGQTPTPSGDELTKSEAENSPQEDIRQTLTDARRVREAQAQPNEEDVRSFLAEARRQGTSRPQGSIAAAVEAASEKGRQAPVQNMNIMESYWNDQQNETFRPEVEKESPGIETYQESSDGQDYAPAPSPIYTSDDARNILNEMHENEIEITNENVDDIAKSIENEYGQANVPQTPPGEKYDSPPKISIRDRLGPKNQDDSQRKTPVKERLGATNSEAQRNTPVRERIGEKPFDSPPRQTIEERIGTTSIARPMYESQRKTPVKDRLGDRPESSGQETTGRSNPVPRRRSRRNRDQRSSAGARLRSSRQSQMNQIEGYIFPIQETETDTEQKTASPNQDKNQN